MFHLLLGNEYDKELTAGVVLRRMCMWAVLSTGAAAPSFFTAQAFGDFHLGGMAVGVLVYILLLTLVTSNTAFNRYYRQPAARRAIHIAIYTRLFVSLVFPIALMVEFPAGMFSVQCVQNWDFNASSFDGTLLITLVQGGILLILLLFYTLMVWAIAASSPTPEAPPVSNCCLECGYDLRGNPQAKMCPECGKAIAPEVRALLAEGAAK